MKWHRLLVVLVVGAALLGCTEEKVLPPLEKEPVTATPESALDLADKAVADLEKALEGTDLDAVRLAARATSRAVGAVAGHVETLDTKLAQEAREAGETQPVLLMSKLRAALRASDQALDAVMPPRDDVAQVREAVPQIKSALAAVRAAVK